MRTSLIQMYLFITTFRLDTTTQHMGKFYLAYTYNRELTLDDMSSQLTLFFELSKSVSLDCVWPCGNRTF